MTVWRLGAMDITTCWLSSLEMVCQACSAAAFSCCLFVGLSAFCSPFSHWKACSAGLRSGDWLGQWRTSRLLALWKSLTAFAGCFGSLSICAVEDHQFCSIWLNLSSSIALCTYRLRPATSINSQIINKHQWVSSTGSHRCPCHYTASSELNKRCCVLLSTRCSFPCQYFSLLVIRVQVNLDFICHRNLIPELSRLICLHCLCDLSLLKYYCCCTGSTINYFRFHPQSGFCNNFDYAKYQNQHFSLQKILYSNYAFIVKHH